MFEIIGLFYLRVLGMGWLWGRRPKIYDKVGYHGSSKFEANSYEVFGNGGLLLPIGMLGTFALVVLYEAIWRWLHV